ncbi:hypothetical protein AHF37_02248 [Paragonimus kellicotti]|nr:hypothetical protein AHF37_02248 [Paragonimus kellicotti]
MDEPSWQDTNLALFGSDEDRRVKKESAMEEEAWVPVLHTHEPRIFVWRIEAAQFLHMLESERLGRCKTTVLDEESVEDNDEFLRALPNIPVKRTKKDMDVGKRMYRLSDESGELKFELVASNGAPKRIINEDDVYFIDTSKELFVFLGSRCSLKEKQNALSYAHSYLQHSTHPLIPITVLSANQHSDAMEEAWDPDRTQYYLH